MSDLSDILAQKRLPQEPPEFPIIRAFVQKKLGVTPKLQIRDRNLIITVPSSAVAGTLRFQLHELEQQLNTEYHLTLATG